MADKTAIEWTDATWNPITGCSVVSAGCTNCYAMKLAGTRLKHTPSRQGLTMDTKAGPVWTGDVRLNKNCLEDPLRWTGPRMIFVCAHGDLFHESVPDSWIDEVFAVMALAPQHKFQILTKRPERMRSYLCDEKAYGRVLSAAAPHRIKQPRLGSIPISDPRHQAFWSHVWLGVSIEDQKSADARLPILLDTPAAIRWVSAEPLLGPILYDFSGIDWLVAGGESGPAARPMHPEWPRSLRDQCKAADVPFFFKQWGEWLGGHYQFQAPHFNDYGSGGRAVKIHDFGGGHFAARVGKKTAGDLLNGVQHREWPRIA